jgi:ribosomal protein L37AE/L43A
MLLVGLLSVPPDWFRATVFSKSLRGLREPANRHRIQQGTNHQCAYCTWQILHVTVSVALWHCIRCFSKPASAGLENRTRRGADGCTCTIATTVLEHLSATIHESFRNPFPCSCSDGTRNPMLGRTFTFHRRLPLHANRSRSGCESESTGFLPHRLV